MNRKQGFHALKFDDNSFFHQKINSIARLQMQAIVNNRKECLCLNRKSCFL